MKPKISVFTATYNRCDLLQRLYHSLLNQRCYDFEWIIIDDDSSDNTEKIVAAMDYKYFPIIYKKQEHGGKHRAINKGLDIAKGEYFFIVDSDDYLPTNSIEQICKWVSDDEFINMVGVSGLKILPNGHICGGNPRVSNKGWVDASNFERRKYKLTGDKAEVYKTEVMRKHRFPEYENEFFVTEGICWDAIAADGGKLRWFNEPIYIADYQPDGLTKSGANELEGHKKNFRGYSNYVRQSLKVKPILESITDFREYNRTCRYMHLSLKKRAEKLDLSFISYINWIVIKMPLIYVVRIIKYKILNRVIY